MSNLNNMTQLLDDKTTLSFEHATDIKKLLLVNAKTSAKAREWATFSQLFLKKQIKQEMETTVEDNLHRS